MNFIVVKFQKPLIEIPQQRVVDAGFTRNQVTKWFDLAKVSFRLWFMQKPTSNSNYNGSKLKMVST